MSTVEIENQLGVGTDVPLSVAVVEAVAAREGVDARTLDPPLDSVVDGDALDALFAASTAGTDAFVEFVFKGYTVVVNADGDVLVEA